jgi:hypothetical protein
VINKENTKVMEDVIDLLSSDEEARGAASGGRVAAHEVVEIDDSDEDDNSCVIIDQAAAAKSSPSLLWLGAKVDLCDSPNSGDDEDDDLLYVNPFADCAARAFGEPAPASARLGLDVSESSSSSGDEEQCNDDSQTNNLSALSQETAYGMGDLDLRELDQPLYAPPGKKRAATDQANSAAKKNAAKMRAMEAKEQKAIAKVREREERERKKALDRKEKAQQTRVRQAAAGKFFADEVACIIDPRLLEEFGQPFLDAIGAQENSTDRFAALLSPPADVKVPGSVWWTRRSKLEGGAAAAAVEGVEIVDDVFAVVYYDASRFVRMLAVHGQPPNSFPEVGAAVDLMRVQAPYIRRIVLVLQGVAMEVNRMQQQGGNTFGANTPTLTMLQDAMAWLVIAKGIECKLTKNTCETATYLWNMTRALAKNPYREKVTAIHCAKRLNCRVDPSSAGPGSTLPQDIWMRQLMMIPGVSEKKARSIVRLYPSARSLVKALTDPMLREPHFLLSDKMGGDRSESKLSQRIYMFMTSTDPETLLN